MQRKAAQAADLCLGESQVATQAPFFSGHAKESEAGGNEPEEPANRETDGERKRDGDFFESGESDIKRDRVRIVIGEYRRQQRDKEQRREQYDLAYRGQVYIPESRPPLAAYRKIAALVNALSEVLSGLEMRYMFTRQCDRVAGLRVSAHSGRAIM